MGNILLRVESQKRQVQQQREPVSIDQEQEGQESVNSGFGDDVGVEAVAEVDRVDVITIAQELSAHRILNTIANSASICPRNIFQNIPFQITVHDREEDLQEQVHCIDDDGEKVQPCFAGHVGRVSRSCRVDRFAV